MTSITCDEKNNIYNILFDIQWILFLAGSIVGVSAWYELDETGIVSMGIRAVKCLCAILCLVIVIIKFFHRIYNLKVTIAFVLLGVVVALSAYYSKNVANVWCFAIFAAAYKQDAKRVVTLSVLVTAFMMLVIIISAYAGLAVNYEFTYGDRVRWGLGFGWTTTAPILYLFLSLEYMYIREEKLRIAEFVILEAVAIYFFVMTNTRMAFAVTSVAIIYLCIESQLKNKWRLCQRINRVWLCVPILITVLCVGMYVFFERDDAIWNAINGFMNGRLVLGQNAIQSYGYTLFGQIIQWNGFSISTPVDYQAYNYVDCSYIQIMLQYGVVFLCAVVVIYTKAIHNAIKACRYNAVCMIIIIMLFSVTEPRLMNIAFNVFPMLAFLSVKKSGIR